MALLIEKADKAINQEKFDALVDLHTEDAVPVIKRVSDNAYGHEVLDARA